MKLTQSILLLMAAVLTACATPTNNVRFYSLADASLIKSKVESQSSAPPINIEVLPINVPERLKRPQLVITSKNSAQIQILEQDRWSSSFNDELQDAFASGLSQQLNAIDISRGGRVAQQPVYRIAIVLQQFSATPGDEVMANFGWAITELNNTARSNPIPSVTCQTTISKTVGNGTNAVVKGLQEAVAEATQAIATNVKNLKNGEVGKCN